MRTAPPTHELSRTPGLGPGRACAPTAFSLVELVVVIAIIGVVAAIATPRFASAAGRARAVAAADRLAAELAVTRDLSRAMGEGLAVRMKTGTGEVVRVKPDATQVPLADLAREPYSAVVHSTSFAGDAARFTGLGTAWAAGRALVRSGRYGVVVSVREDGVVSASLPVSVRPNATPSAALGDAVTDAGSAISTRVIVPGARGIRSGGFDAGGGS
jgi:prepilin-type N-terminal cleavage/methylation domain-containing protein